MKTRRLFHNFSNLCVHGFLLAVMPVLCVSRGEAQDATAPVPAPPPQAQAKGQPHDPKQWEKEFWKNRASGNKSISTATYDRALEQYRALPKANSGSGPGKGPGRSSSTAAPSFGAPVTGVQGTVWIP